MEIIAFTVVGIILYFFCDWVLNILERVHGQPLPQRNLVFFVLILALSVSSFSLIRTLLQSAQGPQNNHQEQQPADRGDQPT